MSRPSTQSSLKRTSAKLPPLPNIVHPQAFRQHEANQMTGILGQELGSGTSRPQSQANANGSKMAARYSPRNVGMDIVDSEVLSPSVGERGYREMQTVHEQQTPRPIASRATSRASSRGELRVDVDELEMMLREKFKFNQNEVQRRFKENDPQGIGKISRDALLRVFIILTGQPLNRAMFQRLLARFGMEGKTSYGYSDFVSISHTLTGGPDNYPNWINKVGREHGDRSTLTASHVHAILKDRAKQKLLDAFGLIPQINPEGARRLLKPEFRNALKSNLQVDMQDDEFERLWQMYDPNNSGTIDSKNLASRLGMTLEGTTTSRPQDKSNCLKRREDDENKSLDIEQWLRNRFRRGFRDMRDNFTQIDTENKGMIPAKEFCQVMKEHGLRLSLDQLDEFLSRCGIVQTKEGVPYYSFLHIFQNRGENGMTHKILTNPKHPYNNLSDTTAQSNARPGTSMSAIETQLMALFQRDFLNLLGIFHNLDNHQIGVISPQEFKAALESSFEMDLSEDQYAGLLEQIPLDRYGNIRYRDFMAQFDSNDDLESLLNGALPAPNAELNISNKEPKSVEETTALVRNLLAESYDEVNKRFSEMTAYDSQTLTQEGFYRLLQRCNLEPPVTRGEIRQLWQTLMTNRDNTVSWQELVRQFGCTGQTHTYEDAGKNPPKYGDSDYNRKSNKLNSDYELLLDTTRQKIEYRWDELRRAFSAIDPYRTGCVNETEFEAIMNGVCTQLSTFDLKQIMRKYAANDARVNYVDFLSEFDRGGRVWQQGNDMFGLLSQPKSPLSIANIVEHPQKGLFGISAKLRNKLSRSWKNLRRAFLKLDKEGAGYLSLPQFRSVLKLANVVLNEDEVYHVMSGLDEDLTGKLDYNRFLSQLFRPESQQSSRAASRLSDAGLLPLSRQSARLNC